MAGSWIKFETSTSDKPEVWEIATQLGIDPDAVVGKLLRVWAWFDDQTEKGNAPSVTSALLDRRVGVTGFVTAMISVGWLEESDGEISIAKFDRHNGETAKTRALTAKRVAKSKKGNGISNAKGNGDSVTLALPRVDKRREEEIHTHTQDARAKGFEDEWQRWLDYRFQSDGKRLGDIQADAVLYKLVCGGSEKAKRDIAFSIEKGARSILDADNDFQKSRTQQPAKSKGFTF